MTSKIKIIIVDDHLLFAEGLEQIIQSMPQFEVLTKASGGKSLLQKMNQFVPDMILSDIHMPDMDGLDAAEHILKARPELRYVFISMYHSPQLISKAKSIGAHGYIMKDVTAPVLKQNLLKVANGEKVFLEPVANKAVNPTFSSNYLLSQYKITEREAEIIKHIKEGNSSKQIAELLELSVYTIETHRKNIYRKLGVQNTAELILIFDKINS